MRLGQQGLKFRVPFHRASFIRQGNEWRELFSLMEFLALANSILSALFATRITAAQYDSNYVTTMRRGYIDREKRKIHDTFPLPDSAMDWDFRREASVTSWLSSPTDHLSPALADHIIRKNERRFCLVKTRDERIVSDHAEACILDESLINN